MTSESVPLPSDRRFGWTFAAIFTAAAIVILWRGGLDVWIWGCAGLAGLLAAAAVIRPTLLHPLNRLWFRFGLALGAVMRPVVLGILFFGVITPTAVLMRLAGRDELALRRISAHSYWCRRNPPGPEPSSLHNQF